jgi:hypothetical protein
MYIQYELSNVVVCNTDILISGEEFCTLHITNIPVEFGESFIDLMNFTLTL